MPASAPPLPTPRPQERQWRRTLSQLLRSGSTPRCLEHVQALLATAPEGWQDWPDPWDTTHRFPFGSSVYANRQAPAAWVEQAAKLLRAHGARIDATTLPGLSPGARPEPVHLALAAHAGQVNAQVVADALPSQGWMEASNPHRTADVFLWLTRVMAQDQEWGNDPTPLQTLLWAMLSATPQLKSGDLAGRVWAYGLGMLNPINQAPLALRTLALGGLDGNVVIPWSLLPPVSQRDFDRMGLGDWAPVPAWSWALLEGVFEGPRMLIQEVVARQPAPWDPNVVLPDGQSLGAWVLQRTATHLPPSFHQARVQELDALGLDWLAGTPGQRPLDIVSQWPAAQGLLEPGRWEAIQSQARAAGLDACLPPAKPMGHSHSLRARI